jgi:bifunctional non-homologous end joining protein LigD
VTLKKYQSKRDFTRTREPAGNKWIRREGQAPLFVIQKHDASRLHYDFRLEMEGVLKSWAVPKGVPMQKGDRRLAVAVEDHPLDYADFEGAIPAGNYGAGTVMVWDTGTYQVAEGDPVAALKRGKLRVTLSGHKLKGEWSLVRMRRGDDDRQWLLIKSGEDLPALSSRAEDRSAVSGRSMAQIEKSNDRQWGARKEQTPARRSPAHDPAVNSRSNHVADSLPGDLNLDRLPKAKPAFIEPMKALLVDTLPRGSEWLYEVKFDGFRALAIKQTDQVSLSSRTAKDLSAKYPEIIAALGSLECDRIVLDGEIVALDAKGRSSFQLLQSYDAAAANRPPLFYYVFDILHYQGRDVTGLPLTQRKELAQSLLSGAPDALRYSGLIRADSARVVRAMKARGLEGLIAKRADSKYEPGQRSGSWVKFKWTNEQEFVIGGYTPPRGTRGHFGAILVGYYEKGELRFAAKVGTGFSEKLLASLFKEFQSLIRLDCPFADLGRKTDRSVSTTLLGTRLSDCTWLKPKLVCQVRFAEWTHDGHLRQPAFLGLRQDKPPKEVIRERAK